MRGYALQLRNPADLLYSRARDLGQRAKIWSALTGRSRRLLALEEVLQELRVSTTEQKHPWAETRLVSIVQIVGSEGRCHHFDRDFYPLHDRNRERWLRIAAARRLGMPLPPVDLIQVGDLYFVRDGHHRISVARALAQPDIEAHVTVWHVSGPLPWEAETGLSKQRPSKPSGPKALVARLYHEILACVHTLRSDSRDGALRAGI